MEYLEKENSLIQRDNEGKLLPVDVTLELLDNKPVIKMTPLTKGDLQELFAKPDSEDEIIRRNIISPSYSEEEFKFIKPNTYGAIKMAILSLSTDSSQEDMQKSTVKALIDKKKDLIQN